MDKKYVAEKRNKSKKYKNPKYNKKPDIDVDKNVSGDYKTSNKRLQIADNQSQHNVEDAIPNNWRRYELDTDNENCTSEGADYETLLLAPVCIDSHFKFKSEQNWDEDIKSQINLSKYFTINIALLNEGISCVPFNKRQGYDDSIFSPLELELMKSTSEANLKNYNKLLKRKFPSIKSDIVITKNIEPQTQNILKTPTNTKKIEETIPEIKKVHTEARILEDDVDDLLNLKCADLVINDESEDIKVEDALLEKIELGKIITPQSQPQPTVDLEQWLDDILDD